LKLLIQPDDHVAPIVAAIKGAKKSVDIVIFRFDPKRSKRRCGMRRTGRPRARADCVCIVRRAHLRNWRCGFLGRWGITVARTANDLVRYHDKLMLIRSPHFCTFFSYQLHLARHGTQAGASA